LTAVLLRGARGFLLQCGEDESRMRRRPAHRKSGAFHFLRRSGQRQREIIKPFIDSLSLDRLVNKPDQSFILFICSLREERRFKSANKEIL
jgi:hypothetical protein